MKNLLLTLTGSITVALLSATAYAISEQIIRSKAETRAQLIEYWQTHGSHGLECADTGATTLRDIGGHQYATFTVDARSKATKLPVKLGMVYDVETRVMYAFSPGDMARFIQTGDRSILSKSLGSESVNLT
jgi:hypothetical protein